MSRFLSWLNLVTRSSLTNRQLGSSDARRTRERISASPAFLAARRVVDRPSPFLLTDASSLFRTSSLRIASHRLASDLGPLGGENSSDGDGIRGVRAEAVNRLGRKSDQPAATQHVGGFFQRRGVGQVAVDGQDLGVGRPHRALDDYL